VGHISFHNSVCLSTQGEGKWPTQSLFCDSICVDMEEFGIPGTVDQRFFVWNSSHVLNTAYVHATVTERVGPRMFSILRRPPYHSKCSPIWCKILELTDMIRMQKSHDWTMDHLENEIHRSASLMTNFDSTLMHCGYKWE
jgi:hypothetical protein